MGNEIAFGPDIQWELCTGPRRDGKPGICGQRLFRGKLIWGTIEVVCRSCKTRTVLSRVPAPECQEVKALLTV